MTEDLVRELELLREFGFTHLDISGGPPSSAAAAEDRGAPLIAEILRQGDLEKFSPWGPRPGDLRALRKRALELIPEEREEAAA